MGGSLCAAVLLCLTGVVFGQICDPATYVGPPTVPLPVLPSQFSVVIEANFGQDNRTSYIKEYVDDAGNRGRFEISSTLSAINPTLGIFNYDDGEIFVIPDAINGSACSVKQIADPSLSPFLPHQPIFGFQDDSSGSVHIETVSRFFRLLRNANATSMGVEDVRGIPCNRWQTCTVIDSDAFTLDYYFATQDWDFALGDGPTPVQVVLTLMGGKGTQQDTYSFVSYDTGPRSVPDEVFTVPFGLVCAGRRPGRPVPSFPDYFSLSLESVQRSRRTAVVYKVSY